MMPDGQSQCKMFVTTVTMRNGQEGVSESIFLTYIESTMPTTCPGYTPAFCDLWVSFSEWPLDPDHDQQNNNNTMNSFLPSTLWSRSERFISHVCKITRTNADGTNNQMLNVK